MEKTYLFVLTFLVTLSIVLSLECYTCINQLDNKEKCIKTTKQCEEHEDMCISDVQWRIPPFWTPRGDRVHQVSKNCTTRAICRQRNEATINTCKRDWYDDWACIECCSGDLCNYYVTLGAGNIKGSIVIMTVSVVMGFVTLQRLLSPS